MNMTRITTGTSVNLAALALKQGQYKQRILRPKKGKGSYSRKRKDY